VTDETKALPAPKQQKSASIWPLWIVILFIAIASGALFFYGWLQLKQFSTLPSDIQQISQQDQQLQQAHDRLVTEVTALRQQRENLSERIQSEQAALTSKMAALSTQLLQMGGASRTEWQLAEAEYLLRLANQRLTIEKDVAGAIKVLESADTLMAETDDAGLFPIRKKLREEILALQMVTDSDQSGIYLQIEAIISGLDTLDQAYFIKHQTAKAANSPYVTPVQKDDAAQEQTLWQQAIAELNKLIVFRKLDAPVEPLLSPEQSVYLKQNLRLLLEQAELAMLKKNQLLYQASLNKSLSWIKKYFPTNEKPVQAIEEQLNQLLSRNIDPELPEISGSLNLLKQRIQLLYKQHALPPQETSGKEGA
jgi:uroporphyrin-3 C-methyltransferase